MEPESERDIFSFHRWTGGVKKKVFADPAKLHRQMLRALGVDDLETLFADAERTAPEGAAPDLVRATDELVFGATDKIISIASATFGLTALDEEGNGVTEAELLSTFTSFLNFLYESKKKASTPAVC